VDCACLEVAISSASAPSPSQEVGPSILDQIDAVWTGSPHHLACQVFSTSGDDLKSCRWGEMPTFEKRWGRSVAALSVRKSSAERDDGRCVASRAMLLPDSGQLRLRSGDLDR
jgi:hypothetical protein